SPARSPGVATAAGACAEAARGAPLPAGADAVVMVEETAPDGDGDVDIFAVAHPGQNVGRRAGDIAAGDSVVAAGDLLTPSRVGAIAAIGGTAVGVLASPPVAPLSTRHD